MNIQEIKNSYSNLYEKLILPLFKIKSPSKIGCNSVENIHTIIKLICENCNKDNHIIIVCKYVTDIIDDKSILSRIRYASDKGIKTYLLYTDEKEWKLSNINTDFVKLKKIEPIVNDNGEELSFVSNGESVCINIYSYEKNESFAYAKEIPKILEKIFIELYYK